MEKNHAQREAEKSLKTGLDGRDLHHGGILGLGSSGPGAREKRYMRRLLKDSLASSDRPTFKSKVVKQRLGKLQKKAKPQYKSQYAQTSFTICDEGPLNPSKSSWPGITLSGSASDPGGPRSPPIEGKHFESPLDSWPLGLGGTGLPTNRFKSSTQQKSIDFADATTDMAEFPFGNILCFPPVILMMPKLTPTERDSTVSPTPTPHVPLNNEAYCSRQVDHESEKVYIESCPDPTLAVPKRSSDPPSPPPASSLHGERSLSDSPGATCSPSKHDPLEIRTLCGSSPEEILHSPIESTSSPSTTPLYSTTVSPPIERSESGIGFIASSSLTPVLAEITVPTSLKGTFPPLVGQVTESPSTPPVEENISQAAARFTGSSLGTPRTEIPQPSIEIAFSPSPPTDITLSSIEIPPSTTPLATETTPFPVGMPPSPLAQRERTLCSLEGMPPSATGRAEITLSHAGITPYQTISSTEIALSQTVGRTPSPAAPSPLKITPSRREGTPSPPPLENKLTPLSQAGARTSLSTPLPPPPPPHQKPTLSSTARSGLSAALLSEIVLSPIGKTSPTKTSSNSTGKMSLTPERHLLQPALKKTPTIAGKNPSPTASSCTGQSPSSPAAAVPSTGSRTMINATPALREKATQGAHLRGKSNVSPIKTPLPAAAAPTPSNRKTPTKSSPEVTTPMYPYVQELSITTQSEESAATSFQTLIPDFESKAATLSCTEWDLSGTSPTFNTELEFEEGPVFYHDHETSSICTCIPTCSSRVPIHFVVFLGLTLGLGAGYGMQQLGMM